MTLMESVYEQWLHTDLRESSSGCLPSHVFGNETGEMRGRFVLQVWNKKIKLTTNHAHNN